MVVWAHYLEQRSYLEIARMLRKPVGTIKSLIHRGKKMLLHEEV
jgi:DNA-directed RNA polymerase specialized sigma24 family protein